MRTFIFCLLLCLLSSLALAADSDELRSFKNENVGNVTLVVPKDWRSDERHHLTFGTTYYRLAEANGDFGLEILVNDLAHMKMDALVSDDLEKYIESNMAGATPQSVEGKATAVRFGSQGDGVYARLTDKAPKVGEFVMFTQGVRLQDTKVVLFTLYSNDKDGSVLKQALAVVESVKFEQ